jgi:hypothetical protein
MLFGWFCFVAISCFQSHRCQLPSPVLKQIFWISSYAQDSKQILVQKQLSKFAESENFCHAILLQCQDPNGEGKWLAPALTETFIHEWTKAESIIRMRSSKTKCRLLKFPQYWTLSTCLCAIEEQNEKLHLKTNFSWLRNDNRFGSRKEWIKCRFDWFDVFDRFFFIINASDFDKPVRTTLWPANNCVWLISISCWP